MRCKYAFCYQSTYFGPTYATLILTVITVSASLHAFGDTIESTTMNTHLHNTSLNTMIVKNETTDKTIAKTTKTRSKRSIIQLAGMIRCVSGCDPFLYKSYGCYCGYLGAGKPVDHIDRCCLEHDWCYTYAACPQILIYFVPYQWSCITPGYARCGIVPFGGVTERCSYQLCECDRAFAKCLSKYSCPLEKPICQSSPFIAIQNIVVGR